MPPPERRFTDQIADARLLKSLFLSEKLKGNEKPGSVRDEEDVFKEFDAKAFGDKFRKHAKLYGKYQLIFIYLY